MITLGACVDGGYSITAYCGQCRLGRRVDLLALIDAFGEHAVVETLWRSPGFRCSRCRAPAASLAVSIDAPSYRRLLGLGALDQPAPGPRKSPSAGAP